MAQRHVAQREAWSEHTKKLPPLPVGTKVLIQNQVGNHPRRWERTGKVVEARDHDQYTVRVDGTGRVTLRNRRFLRSFQPITRAAPTQTPLPPPPNANTRLKSLPVQTFPTQPIPLEQAPPVQQHEEPVYDQPIQAQDAPDEQQYEDPACAQDATPPDLPPEPTVSFPELDSTPAPPELDSTPAPSSPVPANRPRRIRRPNSMLNSDTWDLSSLV